MSPRFLFYALLPTLLILVNVVSAQSDSSRKTFHIGIGYNVLFNYEWDLKDAFNFTTPISVEYKKHLVSISPYYSVELNYRAAPVAGIYMGYQFMPQVGKRLNLYLIYDVFFYSRKIHWEENMMLNSVNYYDVEFNSRRRFFRNQVGYALILKLINRLYIDQGLSVGFEYYDYQSNFDVKDNPDLSIQYNSAPLFQNLKAASCIKVGLRYRIFQDKKLRNE